MNGRSSDLSLLPIAFPRIVILSDFVLGNAVMRNTAAGLFGILTRFPFKQQTAERGVLHQFADKVTSFFFNYKFLRRFFFIPDTALSFKNSSPCQKQHYFIARIQAVFSLVLHFSLLVLTD